MDKNYKHFIEKLNLYVRKYYLYQLLRGTLLFVLFFAFYFILISVFEFFNYFNPHVKLVIACFTVLFVVITFIFYLLKPLLKLFGFTRRINYYDISILLNKSFPEIGDKLINIIELQKETSNSSSHDLVIASINQKINDLRIFDFSDTIKFKDLKNIFLYVFIIFLFLFSIFLFSPNFFRDTSIRLIHVHQQFEKPAPFKFILDIDDLEIISGDNLTVKLKCEGSQVPDIVYINISGNNFLMVKNGSNFSYTIENINNPISFFFTDKHYVSDIYKVTVLNRPFISSFDIVIQPPSYTNISSEQLHNVGDLRIVSGTTVKWTFKTVDTDSLFIVFNDSTKLTSLKTNDGFQIVKTFYNDSEYRISIKNNRLTDNSNLIYQVKTIPDLFPEIKVVKLNDSIDYKTVYFKGNIIDDYGFNRLDFNINYNGKDSVIAIQFIPFLLNQNFYYTFNFETVKHLSKKFDYYFTVYDNDFINHFKKSISETFTFIFPDYQDILVNERDNQNSVDALFNKSSRLTNDIKNELENFKKKQIDSEVSDWEKFQFVNDITTKRNELENLLDQLKDKNTAINNYSKSFSDEKKEILEKQQQIEKLLNEVFNNELKNLFDEFNKLAKQFDTKKFDNLSKQLDSGLEDLSRQLDKNVQLLKRMKVEQKIERVINELDKLSDTEKNGLEGFNKKVEYDTFLDIEKSNNEMFNNILNDYKEAFDLNSTLDKPMKLFDFKNEFSKLNENYSKILESISKKNKRKTVSSVEESVKQIDELKFALEQMLKNNIKKQNLINIDDTKMILYNLVKVSFDQESQLNSLKSIDFNNPLVNIIKINEKNLLNQVIFIKDSLYSLSKRTPQINTAINKEILSLENSLNNVIEGLESSNLSYSAMHQQFGITATNNLALYLNEVLDQLKDAENQSSSGDGDCDKPGSKGSKQSFKQLLDNQQAIKNQLQKMIEQMKKGDLGKMGDIIGKTIANQELMQSLIKDFINNGSLGNSTVQQLKAIDQLLDQTRQDLVNKRISSELINRQNLILTKLLNAEKSEIERDFEEQRESKTATDIIKKKPEEYFKYDDKLLNENEFINRRSFKLRSFYNQKYNGFINQLKK